jgi:hypothetical protein
MLNQLSPVPMLNQLNPVPMLNQLNSVQMLNQSLCWTTRTQSLSWTSWTQSITHILFLQDQFYKYLSIYSLVSKSFHPFRYFVKVFVCNYLCHSSNHPTFNHSNSLRNKRIDRFSTWNVQSGARGCDVSHIVFHGKSSHPRAQLCIINFRYLFFLYILATCLVHRNLLNLAHTMLRWPQNQQVLVLFPFIIPIRISILCSDVPLGTLLSNKWN